MLKVFGDKKGMHKDLKHMEAEILALKAEIDDIMPSLSSGQRDVVLTYILSQMVSGFIANSLKPEVYKLVAGYMAVWKK